MLRTHWLSSPKGLGNLCSSDLAPCDFYPALLLTSVMSFFNAGNISYPFGCCLAGSLSSSYKITFQFPWSPWGLLCIFKFLFPDLWKPGLCLILQVKSHQYKGLPSLSEPDMHLLVSPRITSVPQSHVVVFNRFASCLQFFFPSLFARQWPTFSLQCQFW